MAMARYVVVIRNAQRPLVRVEKELRRADSDRAIVFAVRWLWGARRWLGECVPQYDTYEVYQVDDDGDRRLIQDHHEPERVGPPTAQTVRPAPKKRTMAVKGAVISQRFSPIKVGASKSTGWRQKFRDQLDIAREAATNGIRIPPMGGNPHS